VARGLLTVDRVAGVGLVALGALTLWESRELPLGTLAMPGPAAMPVALALLVLAFGVLIGARAAGAPPLERVDLREWRHAVAILGMCVFAALALERVGYRITMGVALAYLVGAVERKGVLPAVVFAAAMAAGSFYLFDTVLRVPLPRGPLGF
jgi:putative tricarboxylic transport membrane protein